MQPSESGWLASASAGIRSCTAVSKYSHRDRRLVPRLALELPRQSGASGPRRRPQLPLQGSGLAQSTKLMTSLRYFKLQIRASDSSYSASYSGSSLNNSESRYLRVRVRLQTDWHPGQPGPLSDSDSIFHPNHSDGVRVSQAWDLNLKFNRRIIRRSPARPGSRCAARWH